MGLFKKGVPPLYKAANPPKKSGAEGFYGRAQHPGFKNKKQQERGGTRRAILGEKIQESLTLPAGPKQRGKLRPKVANPAPKPKTPLLRWNKDPGPKKGKKGK